MFPFVFLKTSFLLCAYDIVSNMNIACARTTVAFLMMNSDSSVKVLSLITYCASLFQVHVIMVEYFSILSFLRYARITHAILHRFF